MHAPELQSAFYDAMFDSAEGELNALEQETLDSVRSILTNPAALSSHIRPLPTIQVELLNLINNPDAEYSDFAKLIEQEPALASRVLGIVNSALYASANKISNLETAIARIGMQEIANVASSVLMEDIRPPKPIYFKMFGKQIWIHSLQCAFLCKQICAQTGESGFAGHFLGLIHDVGKILVFNCLCDALAGLNYDQTPGSRLFKELMSEMSLDITYFISTEWKLPEAFQIALQQQRKEPETELAQALYKANTVAEMYLLASKRGIDEEQNQLVLEELGVGTELWDSFLEQAKLIECSGLH